MDLRKNISFELQIESAELEIKKYVWSFKGTRRTPLTLSVRVSKGWWVMSMDLEVHSSATTRKRLAEELRQLSQQLAGKKWEAGFSRRAFARHWRKEEIDSFLKNLREGVNGLLIV